MSRPIKFSKNLVDFNQIFNQPITPMITITTEQLTVLANTADVIHVNRNLVKKTEFDIVNGNVIQFNWEDGEGQMFSQPVNVELFEYYSSTGQVRWTDPEGFPVLVSFFVTSPLTIDFKS